jgi:flagellar protein FlgJ
MKVSPLSPPLKPLGQGIDAPKTAKKSREDVDPQIREAAEGLEAMFLNTMLQAMRGTVQESEYSLENPATKIYRGMLDQEVASQTARNNSVGLADQIIAYLEQRGYNGSQAPIHGRTKPEAGSPPSSSSDSRSDGIVQEVR